MNYSSHAFGLNINPVQIFHYRSENNKNMQNDRQTIPLRHSYGSRDLQLATAVSAAIDLEWRLLNVENA